MRQVSSGSVMAALLFGFAAILVTVTAQVTGTANIQSSTNGVNNSTDQKFVPYKGERFDAFDWNLCRNLAKRYSGNMLISPISIKLALILLHEGAQGKTASEIADALQLPDNNNVIRERFSNVLRSLQTVQPEYSLDISTRLIVDKSIEPTQLYSSIVKSYYSTDVVVQNLTNARVALKDINAWVSSVTHGHVKEILTDEEKIKDSIFLLINALYFMGTWLRPFSTKSTKFGNFYTAIDKSVEVSYMNTGGRFYYVDSEELDSQILRLPYLGNKYSMFIVLPRARAGLSQLIQNINPFILRRQIQDMTENQVDVSIPKFKFEFTSHLEYVLRELKINDIFDDSASLIKIARAKQGGQRLRVTDFVQKAGLEVDEVGTTAYAVTEVQIGNKIGDTTFHARHPFLFFIEDETTGTVLFVGQVINPLESSGTIEESVTPIITRTVDIGRESITPVPEAVPGKSNG